MHHSRTKARAARARNHLPYNYFNDRSKTVLIVFIRPLSECLLLSVCLVWDSLMVICKKRVVLLVFRFCCYMFDVVLNSFPFGVLEMMRKFDCIGS